MEESACGLDCANWSGVNNGGGGVSKGPEESANEDG